MLGSYTVSKDSKSGMWYARHKSFQSFSERKEKFEKETKLTEAENIWINGLLTM